MDSIRISRAPGTPDPHVARSDQPAQILPAGMHSSESIARRAQELFRTATGYGMTEVGCAASLSYLDSEFEVRTTMSGWPLNGYEFQIVDPATAATQPPGKLGEICIRGYHVMQGYYRKPEE